MEDIEKRFERFMASTGGVESIDSLCAEKEGSKKADYLWCERDVIVEQKVLRTDPGEKVQRELDKQSGREEYPLFYGSVDVNAIIKRLPNGEEIRKRIYFNITRSLEDIIRSAEKQIRDSKAELCLPESHGLVVILNDAIGILSPNIIVSRISHLLHRTDSDGNNKYPNIEYIWLIQENYEIKIRESSALPLILLSGPMARESEKYEECFRYIQKRWADFNNAPLFSTNADRVSDLNFQEKKDQERPNKITKQELWERQYRASPYLRNLSDVDVLKHGERMFETLLPYFLKGGPRKPLSEMEDMFIGWSNFLEEARHRALDLKGLQIEKLSKELNTNASR